MPILSRISAAVFLCFLGAFCLPSNFIARGDVTTFAELSSFDIGQACLQTGAAQSSCSYNVQPRSGNASAIASFGSLGVYAQSIIGNVQPPFEDASFSALAGASFGDGFTVTGGPSEGFVVFSIAVDGTNSTSCSAAIQTQFSCFGQAAFETIQINGTTNLVNGPGIVTGESFFVSGVTSIIDVLLTAEADCGASVGMNVCTSTANFLDTARVTGYTIEDINGNPVSGASAVFASGTDYNHIPTTTSEPSSLAMLGIGMLALAGLTLKKS
jgi:hypothetical protein